MEGDFESREGQGMPLSAEEIDETLEIIQDEVINTEVTPDNAASFGKRYTQYSKMQIDALLKEQPQLSVMRSFSGLLGRFLQDAQEGNNDGIARFLRSEEERMVSGLRDPKSVRFNSLGRKFGEIANVLSPRPGPQGVPAV